MAVCASCRRRNSAVRMKKEVYRVKNHGKPLEGKKFCSMKCLETYLKKRAPDMEAYGESAVYAPRKNVHVIEVRSKSSEYRHKEANEMNS